ncbi:hypothetical protein [Notoacmeibacter ruber]|uniref:Cyclic di-GMP-binding protein n=1 Tax=Notoacmeibacter ruber TaxID=2670375 RepID=A0A3L7JDU8_9HYPH|nr:hypothetical protein [Notoacmeibacter ruber]RLQ88856.1 hypothetical protein D8780_12115 [Notoacmeibacter ruber]
MKAVLLALILTLNPGTGTAFATDRPGLQTLFGAIPALSEGSAALDTLTFSAPPAISRSASGDRSTSPAIGQTDALSSSSDFRRVIGLDELGFETGLEFQGMTGRRDLFFPAPSTASSLHLRLVFRAGAAHESRRTLRILVNGRSLVTRALQSENENFVIDEKIGPAAIREGFLRVSIEYSGAFTEDRCLDERVGGDFLQLQASSQLSIGLSPEALTDSRDILALLPKEIDILIPRRALAAEEAEALIRLKSLFAAQGRTVRVAGLSRQAVTKGVPAGIWSRGLIAIGQADELGLKDPGSDSVLRTTMTVQGPALLVSGESQSSAVDLLTSRWRDITLGDRADIAVVERSETQRETFRLTDLQSTTLVDSAVFETGFSVVDLPAGTLPSHIDIALALSPDFESRPATLVTYLNGVMLNGSTTEGGEHIRQVSPIPSGLLARDNSVEVRLQRQPLTGNCANPPQGFDVQLLPSSRLRLVETGERPSDFFELSSIFAKGVSIFLPESPKNPEEWQALSNMITALIPARAPVDVRIGAPTGPIAEPFIFVGPALPKTMTAPLSLHDRRLVLRDADGRILIDIEGGNRPGIVQIAATDKAYGLWWRPGTTEPAEALISGLDRGNIAIIEEGRIGFAFSTERDRLVEIDHPTNAGFWNTVRGYRAWMIGAVWLALTAGFVAVLSVASRRRRGSQ